MVSVKKSGLPAMLARIPISSVDHLTPFGQLRRRSGSFIGQADPAFPLTRSWANHVSLCARLAAILPGAVSANLERLIAVRAYRPRCPVCPTPLGAVDGDSAPMLLDRPEGLAAGLARSDRSTPKVRVGLAFRSRRPVFGPAGDRTELDIEAIRVENRPTWTAQVRSHSPIAFTARVSLRLCRRMSSARRTFPPHDPNLTRYCDARWRRWRL